MRIKNMIHSGIKIPERVSMSLSCTAPVARKPKTATMASKGAIEGPDGTGAWGWSNITKRHAAAPISTSSKAPKGLKRKELKTA